MGASTSIGGVGDSVGYDPNSNATASPPPARAKPDPWKILQDRASALLDHGRYEEAYRMEKAGHEGLDEDKLLDYDRLPDATLFTGRYVEAQRLLVQAARLGPGREVVDGTLRIDGPHVWIEFVCQNGIVVQNPIQYHSIWRDRVTDYDAAYGF